MDGLASFPAKQSVLAGTSPTAATVHPQAIANREVLIQVQPSQAVIAASEQLGCLAASLLRTCRARESDPACTTLSLP